MLYVSRASVEKPAWLKSTMAKEATEELRQHYLLPLLIRHARRAPVKRHLWADASVRQSLSSLFRGKCAYCEQLSSAAGLTLEVSHVRPLRNATGNGGPPSIDHYSWLAYDWQNLVIACTDCNNARGNCFPTRNLRAAPMQTSKACDKFEKPLLLNPCNDPPQKHLTFEANGRCVALSDRGRATIEINQLNRSELMEARAAHFDSILAILEDLQESDNAEQFNSQIKRVGAALDSGREFAGALLLLLHRPQEELARSFPWLKAQREMSAPNVVTFLRDVPSSLIAEYISALLASVKPYTPDADSAEYQGNFSSQPGSLLESEIRKIEIRNFKAIKDLTLVLGQKGTPKGLTPVAALLGENSVGKSSILQAIALTLIPREQLARIPRRQLSAIPHRAHQTYTDEAPRSATVIITFASGLSRSLGIASNGDVERHGDASAIVAAYGAHRMFSDESRQHADYPAAQATQSLLFRTKILKHPSGWLHTLDDARFFAVARALHDILALSPGDGIERDDQGNVIVKRNGDTLAIEDLSDGYRSLFAMALDIMRTMMATFGDLESAAGFVLIDEIELHLHPSWKMKVVAALRRAIPNTQFIFTTHDPLCLRGLFDGEAHVILRTNDGEIRLLEGLPDVRLMRAEQLLTSEFFGLSSTSDPALLDELNADADHRGSKESPSLNAMPIGDTQDEQVVNEALRRHVRETLLQHESDLDRSKVREDAVQEVLSLLRRHHGSART